MLAPQIKAEQAKEWGLIWDVVEDAELMPKATELARRLADGPALAYSTTKVLLTRELDMALGDAVEMEALAQALLMKSDDFREFYEAWSAGRSPTWTGR
jgi:enoyl-CoA hydratase/carnithine racemase